jgi:hypothetical protein
MSGTPLGDLLYEIECSGSGSPTFWTKFLGALDVLSESDLRRLIMAVGNRAVPIRLAVARGALRIGPSTL